MSSSPHTILCLSSQSWDEPMWTNKQHIMSRLAREHRVVHFDFEPLWLPHYIARRARRNPADLVHPLRMLTDGVVQRDERLHIASSWCPLIAKILPHPNPARDFFYFDMKCLMLKRFLERERISDPIVWVYHPGYADAVDRLPKKLLVYDCVDEYSAFPTYRSSAAWITERERRLCEKADLVLTTSKSLYERKAPYNPTGTHFVHNVGDAAHFRTAMSPETVVPDDIARLPRPVLGFVGAVSNYKLNTEWVLHLARRHPAWSIAIVGPVGLADPSTNVSELRRQSNVHLLGARPYADLPRYIKGFDAALIPYRINDYTRSVFPIKFFELMATGKPLVISNLPSLEEYYSSVLVASTQEEFVARCEEAVAQDAQGSEGKASADREARLALAEANSWPKRIGAIMALIEGKLAEKGRR